MPGYWVADWSGANRCRPVDYESAYAITTHDDYKRCVCDTFGQGDASCAHEEEEPSEEEEEEEVIDDEEEEEFEPIVSFAILDEIRASPHYEDGTDSRTLYQVDREMDFIEKKMLEMYNTLLEAGVIQQ